MSTKHTISITDARKDIFGITEEVQKPGLHFTLTEKGRPKAVIMSAEEFESWQETLEVMRDFPNLREDIKAAEREYKAGKYITLDDLLAKEGYVLNDKGGKQYAVRSRHTGKSSKRHQPHR